MTNSHYYNKNGLAILSMAKELLLKRCEQRLEPLQVYAVRYQMAVATMQKALIFLEEEGVVTLERHGKKGTKIIAINNEKLWTMSGINHLVCSFPPPYSLRYQALATAISKAFPLKIPLYFAHIRGAKTRLKLLCDGHYNMSVVSKLAAREAINRGQPIEVVLEWPAQSYLNSHIIIGKSNSIRRIGVDDESTDHQKLAEIYFNRNDVEFVPIKYNMLIEALDKQLIDATVWNNEDLANDKLKKVIENQSLKVFPLKDEVSMQQASSACLTIRRDDLFMRTLIQNFFDLKESVLCQQRVLNSHELVNY